MRFSFSTVILAALTLGFASCNEGGNTAVESKPMTGSDKAAPAAPAVNAKPQAFDPAKDAAQAPAGPTTSMVFDTYEHDFGTLDEGDAVTHVFSFTNTGSEPLLLEKCKGSCGCTVPQCPKTPIAPGAQGEIEVKFNSKGKKNNQTKTVTINANTDPAQTILKIKAFVNPAETK